MTDLEKMIFSYYVAKHAADFTMADRFYPYGELTLIWEDKVSVAVRKFGSKVKSKAKGAATALLDRLIAEEAYSTKQNDFGGSMHNFKPERFRQVIAEINAHDPLILAAQGDEGDYWANRFAELTA